MSLPLEEKVPFAESGIWDMQRRYFADNGIKAWIDEVPHYVTNNPVMARTYAEIIFALLRDLARTGGTRSEQPVYIVELGAGMGKLAYLVLRLLDEFIEGIDMEVPRYCYVMTDLSEKNAAYWRDHPRFQTYKSKGMVDFAVFDAAEDTHIHLACAGTTIQPGMLSQPLVVVANYLFDCIPQDLFYIEDGSVHECRISLQVSDDDTDAPVQPNRLQLMYHYRPLAAMPYCDEMNAVLEGYKSLLRRTHLLFPSLGLRCLNRLQALSNEGILLLSSDKGQHKLERLEGLDAPKLTHHGGCFSLTLNYHAIADYFHREGARVSFTQHRHYAINTGYILHARNQEQYVESMLSMKQAPGRWGPDDFFVMKSHFQRTIREMRLGQILAYLRASDYDSELFKRMIPRIRVLLAGIDAMDKKELHAAILRVWDRYYFFGEDDGLNQLCGMLLYDMNQYKDCLAVLETSVAEKQRESAALYYNMAICHLQLERSHQASRMIRKALSLDPKYQCAVELAKQLGIESK